MDRSCKVHPRKDLDLILKNHESWLEKYHLDSEDYAPGALPNNRDPLRADLSGAVLMYVDLRDAELLGANLSNAYLWAANLSHADLIGADLTDADLEQAQLARAQMFGANLTGAVLVSAHLAPAYLEQAHLSRANLFLADLSGSILYRTDLTRANLVLARLTDARLGKADLTGAQLGMADLSGSDLAGADLSDVDLTQAKLWNVIFEPRTLPLASSIARAEGLRTLRWRDSHGDPSQPPSITVDPTLPVLWSQFKARWSRFLDAKAKTANQDKVYGAKPPEETEIVFRPSQNEYPVLDLRKKLHDAGYDEADREVNLAYRRRVERWWEIPLFDWTCEWGANWSRPVFLVGMLGLVCSLVYWSFLRFTRRNHLYVVARKGPRERQLRVGRDYEPPGWLPATRPRESRWRCWPPWRIVCSVWVRLRWEFPLFWTAVLFSLMGVVNLGVQGLDLGRWIRLMQRREFDLKARGTIRVVAGLQSVLSFALLALAVVSYFGHPFE